MIEIVVENLGTMKTKGSVTLYKNGRPVKVWRHLTVEPQGQGSKFKGFKHNKSRKVILRYLYDPDRDAGKTVVWTAKVVAAGDQNLSNNTAGPKSTTVKKCRHDGKKDRDHGPFGWKKD
jgi:hypothetical protein